MKIMICGSMSFAREMLEAKGKLEGLGHEVLLTSDAEACVDNPGLNMDREHCHEKQIDKECFDKVAESDAILVVNYPKDGIEGYVGGATLMEIGIARHMDKKIFLLHDPPREEKLRYAFEIGLTNPIVLNGRIDRIGQT
ncbi:MAG: hypothetical protein JXC85_03195 [Candidatus Aenigmarchaeota archaeon]|nr:hypothetical protein [Candidatus Aenigmarchaeota archaeon]